MNDGRFRPREASNRTLWTIQCVLDAVSEPTAAEMGNGNGSFRHAHDQEHRSRCPPLLLTLEGQLGIRIGITRCVIDGPTKNHGLKEF